jgi:uncharacterized DUF497 family protein
MRVIWDPQKSTSNLKKHGIRFSDAATVLDDQLALTVTDDRHDEQRFVTLGCDIVARLLVVVYAYDEAGDIRLISARRATRAERKDYESEID